MGGRVGGGMGRLHIGYWYIYSDRILSQSAMLLSETEIGLRKPRGDCHHTQMQAIA